MELTPPTGGHETIEEDQVQEWRAGRRAALVQRGCPPRLALRILR